MSPSFAYIYDGMLEHPSWVKQVARMEAEVGRLGVQGPILRQGFHEVESKLKEVLEQGIKNLIFVGTDPWFLQWIPWIAEHRGISVGYLPLQVSALGQAFGIPPLAAGVGVLAARVIRTIDLGSANQRPFLTEAIAIKTSAKLELEGSYAVSARAPSPLAVQNFAFEAKKGRVISTPADGLLEAVIQTSMERKTWLGLWKTTDVEETRIAFTKACVKDDPEGAVQFTVDGMPMKAKEVNFSVLPGAMEVIVGPDRGF
ncbi:hypothetical protein KBB27_00615 [Patescibacteria group bacterium]|nr:hypothetical protein [Patescibacteria group bacterium]